MKVRFRREALDHIIAIQLYIEGTSPDAARRVARRIYSAAGMLGSFPRLGHAGAVRGTYELTVRPLPYIIVYEPDRTTNEIIVLAVFHGAQSR